MRGECVMSVSGAGNKEPCEGLEGPLYLLGLIVVSTELWVWLRAGLSMTASCRTPLWRLQPPACALAAVYIQLFIDPLLVT